MGFSLTSLHSMHALWQRISASPRPPQRPMQRRWGYAAPASRAPFCIALSPLKKVSRYSLVSDEHIKIRLDQGSLYRFSFMLATGNGYDITVVLPGYLSKIIEFNGNQLVFNLLILSSIFAYRDVITL